MGDFYNAVASVFVDRFCSFRHQSTWDFLQFLSPRGSWKLAGKCDRHESLTATCTARIERASVEKIRGSFLRSQYVFRAPHTRPLIKPKQTPMEFPLHRPGTLQIFVICTIFIKTKQPAGAVPLGRRGKKTYEITYIKRIRILHGRN